MGQGYIHSADQSARALWGLSAQETMKVIPTLGLQAIHELLTGTSAEGSWEPRLRLLDHTMMAKDSHKRIWMSKKSAI